jgi:hypothetical protein
LLRVLRAIAVAGSLAVVACGSSEADPPLILGADGASTAPGPRTLTSSQSRALQRKITGAGETCEEIVQAYLRDVAARAEAWEVRCSGRAFTVQLSEGGPGSDVADPPQVVVRPCVEAPVDEPPCFVPRTRFGFGRRSRDPGPLNPELGKLLEPMTAKEQNTDERGDAR